MTTTSPLIDCTARPASLLSHSEAAQDADGEEKNGAQNAAERKVVAEDPDLKINNSTILQV